MASLTESTLLSLNDLLVSKRENRTADELKYEKFSLSDVNAMLKLLENLCTYYEKMLKVDIYVHMSALFHEENGLVAFLKNITSCKELERVKISSLKLLAYVYTKYHEFLLIEYYKTSREVLLDIALTDDTSAGEKEKSLDGLILNLTYKTSMTSFEINEILSRIIQFQSIYRNPPGRVFQKIYLTMGVICAVHTNVDSSIKLKAINTILGRLKHESAGNSDYNPRYAQGCIDGLRELLTTQKLDEYEIIYRAISFFLDTNSIKLREKALSCSCLKLFTQHMNVFSTYLRNDFLLWHKTLIAWAKEQHSELHKLGIEALTVFYNTLSNPSFGSVDVQNQLLEHFIPYFKNIIENKREFEPFEIGTAIQGLGQFFVLYAHGQQKDEVIKFFNIVITRAETNVKSPNNVSLEYLPQYILCIGKMLPVISQIELQSLETIKYLCIYMIENYPKLPIYAHVPCVCGIFNIIDGLSNMGILLDDFLQEFVYQAIISTCSHLIKIDADYRKEQLSAYAAYYVISYDRYLPLWKSLLMIDKVSVPGLCEKRQEVFGLKIFDYFNQSLLSILNKLDFSIKSFLDHDIEVEKMDVDEQPGNTINEKEASLFMQQIGIDPEKKLASKPKDFRIFVNLVDLYNSLIILVPNEFVSDWSCSLTEKFIILSRKYPIISGFYKLIAGCLGVTTITEEDAKFEKYQFCQLINKYFRDVLSEIAQYKGDLLVSCLEMLLNTPLVIVPSLLPFLLPAYQSIFMIGQNYLSLAINGIKTLKQWTEKIISNDMKNLVYEILPLLNKFLVTGDDTDSLDSSEEMSKLYLRKKIIKRNIRHSEAGEKDSDLSLLQYEIVIFLLSLDLSTVQSLTKIDTNDISSDAISWSNSKLLRFYLPFTDIKICLCLEKFLPRIIHLAMESSDRRIRVTSCELLHASISFMLGTSVQIVSSGSEIKDIANVFSKIIKPTLILSCDPDILIQDIFRPQILQLTHYYSSNAKINSTETKLLMDALLEGISDETNVTLREFSGICLKEFVIWSIKQGSSRNGPLKIENILQHIYYFCTHPNPAKRLGGALAVNCLYTVIREHDDLISKYTIEILDKLMFSLQLSEGKDIFGLQEQIEMAIKHIERMVKERPLLFNMSCDERKIPTDFCGGTMKDIILWLFRFCSSPNIHCRIISKDLLLSLLKKVDEFENKPSKIIELLEKEQGKDFYLKNNCEPTFIKFSATNISEATQWIKQIIGCIDIYIWMLEYKMVNPLVLFTKDSRIIKITNTFINEDYSKIDRMIKTANCSSPIDLEELISLKGKTLIMIVDFYYFLIQNGCGGQLSLKIDSNFWQLLSQIIFEPQEIGFELKFFTVLEDWNEKIARFLISIEKCPGNSGDKMRNSLNTSNYINKANIILDNIEEIVKQGANKDHVNFVKGICLLLESKIMLGISTPTHKDGTNILKNIYDSFVEEQGINLITVHLNKTSQEFLQYLLKIAYFSKFELLEFIRMILDQSSVTDAITEDCYHHGDIFLLDLKPKIIEIFNYDPLTAIKLIMNEPDIGRPMIRLCLIILQSVYSSNDLRKDYGNIISVELLNLWNILHKLSEAFESDIIEIVSYITNMLEAHSMEDTEKRGISYNKIMTWLNEKMLNKEISLNHKRKYLDIITPLFSWNDKHTQRCLTSILKFLTIECFPLKSTEFPYGSSKLLEYVNFYTALLKILLKTNNMILMEHISLVIFREESHVNLEITQNTFTYVIKKLDLESQMKVLDMIFAYVKDERYEYKIRSVDLLLVHLLQNVKMETFQQFFVNHIKEISELVSKPINITRNLSEHHVTKQLAPFICFYELIEVLYSRMPLELLKADSELGILYKNGGDRVMSKEFLKVAMNPKKETFDVSNESKEIYIKYQSCALKALISIVCRLFPDITTHAGKYASYILNAPPNTFWSKIIDCEKKLNLKMEFEELPIRKERLVSLRHAARNVRKGNSNHPISFARYPASYRLFDSSLSEDISKFDFSHIEGESELMNKEDNDEQEEIILELDEINKHECMPLLCALIRRLSSSTNNPNDTVPPWITNIRKVLLSKSEPPNVKIFIIKLMLNEENSFKPYAQHFIDPLCLCISDKSLGDHMNYLISDTVSMLLTWHEIATPSTLSEKMATESLFNFLIGISFSHRTDIQKHNVELLKLMIEVWKPAFKHQLIIDLIKSRNVIEKNYALQLTAIFIANKILPWNQENANEFIDCLTETHFMDVSRKTARLAAIVLGLIIHWGKEEEEAEPPLLIDHENLISQITKKFHLLLYSNKNSFFQNILIIHQYYNPIVNRFVENLLFDYPKQIDTIKNKILQLISTLDDDLFEVRYLQNLNLNHIMTGKNTDDVRFAIEIITKLIAKMTINEAKSYIECIEKVLNNNNASIRKIAYKLLMEVIKYKKDLAEWKDMIEISVKGLMIGLNDPDEDTLNTIIEFWSSENGVSLNAKDRFLQLCKCLFVKDAEYMFLSSTIHLMLEATLSSRDYENLIFERPLSDENYQVYEPSCSWRTRTSSMLVPLFADSILNLRGSFDISSIAPGHLRATQTQLAFVPTAELEITNDEDNDEIIFPETQEEIQTFSETISNLFTLSKAKDTRTAGDVYKRKYRFMSDKRKTRASFARKEIQLREKRQQLTEEHKARSEGAVKLYRTYRIGDFPDIQIKYSAIIKPLQIISKHDQFIAQQLFVDIFNGIINEVNEEYSTDICNELQRIYQSDIPYVTSALMDISLIHDSFELNSTAITKACSSHSLASVGCLLIEKLVNTTPNPMIKRPRMSNDTNTQDWLNLAKLYQSIDENDTVLAILDKTVGNKIEDLNKAAKYESELQWSLAVENYEKCINASGARTSPEINIFAIPAYYRCLQQISGWDELNKCVREHIDPIPVVKNINLVWQDESKLNNLLPLLLKSEVYQSLIGKSNKELQDELLNWCKNKEKLLFLKNEFSEELSLFNVLLDDTRKASLYSRNSIQNFLNDWKSLSNLQPQVKLQRLSRLYLVYEILESVRVVQYENGDVMVEHMSDVIDKWKCSTPGTVDSLSIWELRILYRNYFIESIFKKKLRSLDFNIQLDNEKYENFELNSLLNIINLAIQQKNISVALKYSKKVKDIAKDNPKFSLLVCRARNLLHEATSNIRQKFTYIMNAYGDLKKLINSGIEFGEELRRVKCELAELGWTASKLIKNNTETFDKHKNEEQIIKIFPSIPINANTVIQQLEEEGKLFLDQAYNEASLVNDGENMTNIMLVIAKHSKERLDSGEIDKDDVYEVGVLAKGLITAMNYESSTARLLFPTLLTYPCLSTDNKLREEFIEQVKSTPDWMFLSWINQLLANIDTDMLPIIEDILYRLAANYPKAIRLQYNFTIERITKKYRNQMPSKLKAVTDRMNSILGDDHHFKNFITALSYLKQPEKSILNILKEMQSRLKSNDKLKDELQNLFDELWDIKSPILLHGTIYGSYPHIKDSIQKAIKPLLEGHVTPTNTTNAQLELQKVFRELDNKFSNLKKQKFNNRLELENYSKYLHDYKGGQIEFPGQYEGDKLPLPASHVTIYSFHPKIEIIHSQQFPIKITIVGNNGKSYDYLIKNDEDLRQDERIQQLFKQMNNIFAYDVNCKKFNIPTYKVTPINSRFGMIEFVTNCKSMNDFLKMSATKSEKDKLETKIQIDYFLKIKKLAKVDGSYKDIYDGLYKNRSRLENIKCFEDTLHKTPNDLLYRSYYQLSASSEGLYWLRKNFIESLGVMNIAHWILGIGDRHLSNILISQTNGKAIGIDFGHAFGTATQFLPIAELIPFRLTQSILYFLGPLSYSGNLRATMIKCLRALRDNHDVLYCIAQVFAMEPTLNWKENSWKIARYMGETSKERHSGNEKEYIDQLMMLLKRKLLGAHPTIVMEKELCTGVKNENSIVLSNYIKVLRGDDSDSYREKIFMQELSKNPPGGKQRTIHSPPLSINDKLNLNFTVEQQVDCLLDQATDKEILSKTYVGWRPWL